MRGRVQQSCGQLVGSRGDAFWGWLLAAFGCLLYGVTAEPSVSFWDCGEFIAASHGLEVGHPPGAPLYWLLAHLFSWLSCGNAARVALCCNLMSGVATGLTAMLLYHSLLMIFDGAGGLRPGFGGWRRRGAALAGGAVYMVCDTVWYSATESEVYALAMLLAALMLWAMLRWRQESAVRQPRSPGWVFFDAVGKNCQPGGSEAAGQSDAGVFPDRWLLLAALLAGLSVCVHFIALLVLPALFMIYCKKRPVFGFVGGTLLLAVVFKLLVPGWFRLIEFGGLLALAALTALLLAATILFRKRTILPAALLLFTIGLSPYIAVMLRAQASPPLNEGNPATGQALGEYLRREQYEQAPLLYGRCYNSPVVDVKDGKPVYAKEMNMLFPRMWRGRELDCIGYYDWTLHAGSEVTVRGHSYYKPSQVDNISFLLAYQVGYMYLRYLMWNFSGRYNDNNGLGAVQDGQLITGVPPIDRLIVGNGMPPPQEMRSKAYNRYFMLPLIVGIIGLFAMRRRNARDYHTVMTLFVYSGIMVVLYLNMPPYEPRERDYVYIMNIYAFCLWIGYGLYSLLTPQPHGSKPSHQFPVVLLGRLFPTASKKASGVALCIGLPLLMGCQNFDDHNRHGRYAARDAANNLLQSCDSNAILFTYGDNDTFPLWYLQEVEGVRKDITVVNISLLYSHWYREQTVNALHRHETAPLPEALTCGTMESQIGEILRAGGKGAVYRPVYLSPYAYSDLRDRFVSRPLLSGMVYRIQPAAQTCEESMLPAQSDSIAVDASLAAFMGPLQWTSRKGACLDETGRRFMQRYLGDALLVANRLVAEGRTADAAMLWRHVALQLDFGAIGDLKLRGDMAQSLIDAGCIDEGSALWRKTAGDADARLRYYEKCSPLTRRYLQRECDNLKSILAKK